MGILAWEHHFLNCVLPLSLDHNLKEGVMQHRAFWTVEQHALDACGPSATPGTTLGAPSSLPGLRMSIKGPDNYMTRLSCC